MGFSEATHRLGRAWLLAMLAATSAACGLVLGIGDHELAAQASDGGVLDSASTDAPSTDAGAVCGDGGCFYPSGAVTPGDVAAVGAAAIILVDSTTIHTETGAIDGLRGAGEGVLSGIGFRKSGNVGVFTFRALTINAPAVHLDGTSVVALVSSGKLILNGGTLDAQGPCTNGSAGPGGGPGGMTTGTGAGGGGVGSVSPDNSGGGGGGFGGVGGAGARTNLGSVGGVAGPSYGAAILIPLLGGSGGGAGGGGGRGGGGGGGVQLVSADSILIAGQVNAGGCGGAPGGSIQNTHGPAGGGGGSGGAILIEAPTVTISGVLAANGGGGGGGSTGAAGSGATAGANGGASAVKASGGSGTGSQNGGAGGAGLSANGDIGEAPNNYDFSGAGGGAVGRIRLNTLTGAATITGTVSPSLAPADGGTALATQGTIDIH